MLPCASSARGFSPAPAGLPSNRSAVPVGMGGMAVRPDDMVLVDDWLFAKSVLKRPIVESLDSECGASIRGRTLFRREL